MDAIYHNMSILVDVCDAKGNILMIRCIDFVERSAVCTVCTHERLLW